MAFNVRSVDPSAVNAPAFNSRIFILFDTVAVIHLDFVPSHQIDAGIGVFGYAELDMQLHVSEFALCDRISTLLLQSVDNDTLAGRDDELFSIGRIQGDRFCGHPFTGIAPTLKVGAVKGGILGGGDSDGD